MPCGVFELVEAGLVDAGLPPEVLWVVELVLVANDLVSVTFGFVPELFVAET